MTEPVEPLGWAHYDHLQVAALEDPGPLLKELRSRCPVGRSEQHGGYWVIMTHAEAVAAAQRPEIFSSSVERGPGPGFPFELPLKTPMIGDDDPQHHDFRQPLLPWFSPKRAEAMRPAIRGICRDLIDAFVEDGEADLALDYTMGVPALVTSELLDLPVERRREFHRWAQDVVATGGDTPSFGSLIEFITDLYHQRLASPGEDIPSRMLSFTTQGRPITTDEWIGMVMLLILAGLDTTSNGGALFLHFLGTRPDVRNHLLEDPSRVPAAVEEALRYLSPVPQHSRGVQEDVVIAGQEVPAGDVIQLNWMSANRDPAEFPDPDTFVPDRSPNRHVAFGSGRHRCLGLHLARVEMQEMVSEVLVRMADYEVVETVRYPGLNRGVSSLRVRFTPGERSAA